VEVDNSPRPDAVVEFGLDRAGTGEFERKVLDGERDQRTTLRLAGPDDALLLTTSVRDWAFDLNTAGVYGTRVLRLRLLDPADPRRGELKDAAGAAIVATDKITIDGTAPVVKLAVSSKSIVRGKSLGVSASATDAESGIKSVLFFVGDPPPADAKPSASNKVFAGVPARERGGYTTVLPMPAAAGRVTVGVRAVNGVDMAADDTLEIDVVDPPELPKTADGKAKPTTGAIKGQVVQFSEAIPQPGLTVNLFADDKATAPLKSATTDENGKFAFEELAPGSYVVRSIKPKDRNAKATATTAVVAGKTSEVVLNLKR